MFKKKSLESILSTFTKTVQDLRVLQQVNAEEIGKYEDKILAYQALKEKTEMESAKAKSVEDKINSLLE